MTQAVAFAGRGRYGYIDQFAKAHFPETWRWMISSRDGDMCLKREHCRIISKRMAHTCTFFVSVNSRTKGKTSIPTAKKATIKFKPPQLPKDTSMKLKPT